MMQLERKIWFALFVSTVIYAVIAFLFGQRGASRPFEMAVRNEVVLILYGVALLMFVIGTSYAIVLRERPFRLRMIASLAVYESCCLFGLITAFMYADWRLFLAPWALTIVGFLRVFPTSEPS